MQSVSPLAVNSVCWAPHDYGLILACGSSDGAISLLSYTGDGQWEVKKISNAHTDGRVFIWTCDDASGNSWSPKLLHKFNDVVWHVSWSITANILAVSGGDNKVTLWKESVDGLWACISDVNKGQGGVSAVTEGQQNEQ
ncbi:hypothetical protein llap_20633 [Limosa lapponica baueri]|uniref:Protein SEC13 homolog n=1 Tax=Limosa lapponica baueri TaxID=1758121 RepID=A0A2I0T5I8_LIMLA|nr:hypothetical protein llap_20633 [Limosa lapponica baueri]